MHDISLLNYVCYKNDTIKKKNRITTSISLWELPPQLILDVTIKYILVKPNRIISPKFQETLAIVKVKKKTTEKRCKEITVLVGV